MNADRQMDLNAFRFSLTAALESRLSAYGSIIFEEKNSDYYKQQYAYLKVPVWNENEYKDCASVVSDILARFEPAFLDGQSKSYHFYHNNVRKGKRPFDGRSTFVVDDSGKSLGFSCGREPSAQERPALFCKSDCKLQLLDIGESWFHTGSMGIKYIDSLNSVGNYIAMQKGKKWSDLFQTSEEKFEVLYSPILEALKSEIEDQCSRHKEAVPNILRHFFGQEDYYLIALQPDIKKVKVSAYSVNGKLYLGKDYSDELVPEELIDISYKERVNSVSSTTLQLTFDKGWIMNMRLRTTDNVVGVGPRIEIDFKESRPYKLKSAVSSWK